MADRVELSFRRAADRLLPDPEPVLAAVSGGGDSVALAHLLARRRAGRPFELTVAHLDHGLRRGSATDRRFVERLAAELGLPCVSERRDVSAERRTQESPEEAARRVRRSFLLRAARKSGARWVATGHTLDDQAETVLLRLVRGAGAKALTGMQARGPGPFVRPLLHLERAELRGFLERHRLAWRRDPSNRDLRHDRNRVRRLVLPVLCETLNPHAARRLVAAADRFREDAACLDDTARATFEQLRRSGAGVALDAPRLAALPAPVGRRVLALALGAAGVDRRRITSRHLDALWRLLSGPDRARLDLPGRRAAILRRPVLRIRRQSPPG